jgi:hypothetical protein
MTARASPRPPLRRGARETLNPHREGARKPGRAAVPSVRENRVSHLSRQHRTGKQWLRTSPSAAPPGVLPSWQRASRGETAGAARGAWRHTVDIA